jgi:hypothetical protein
MVFSSLFIVPLPQKGSEAVLEARREAQVDMGTAKAVVFPFHGLRCRFFRDVRDSQIRNLLRRLGRLGCSQEGVASDNPGRHHC